MTESLYNLFFPMVTSQDCTPVEDLDPDSPLFHIPLGAAWFGLCSPISPLIASDGHQLTAQEWVPAAGEVTITCTDEGTRYAFRFQDLVPDGVYSIWHNPPDGSFGALASHPGDIRKAFTATASGTAEFSVVGTAGPLTVEGSVPSCTLPIPTRRSPGGRRWGLFWVEYHESGQAGGEARSDDAVGHLVFEVQ